MAYKHPVDYAADLREAAERLAIEINGLFEALEQLPPEDTDFREAVKGMYKEVRHEVIEDIRNKTSRAYYQKERIYKRLLSKQKEANGAGF